MGPQETETRRRALSFIRQEYGVRGILAHKDLLRFLPTSGAAFPRLAYKKENPLFVRAESVSHVGRPRASKVSAVFSVLLTKSLQFSDGFRVFHDVVSGIIQSLVAFGFIPERLVVAIRSQPEVA